MSRAPLPNVLDDILGPASNKVTRIAVDDIRTDGGTQMRDFLNTDTVNEYTELMSDGGMNDDGPFPPIVVFHDGEAHWLADGFHRVAAARRKAASMKLGGLSLPADVRAGTRRDAVLFAAAANASHGLRRTRADKRRAIETLLHDEEWSQWSDREIARRCNVSADLVGEVRTALRKAVTVDSDSEPPAATRTFTTKHGTPATMHIANIGRRAEQNEADWRPPGFGARVLEHAAPVPALVYPDKPLVEWTEEEWAAAGASVATQPPAPAPAPPVSERADYDGDEWYTPEEIVRTASGVMNRIDVDPATCELAQSRVQAATYYTKFDDGLKQEWRGSVWLNPPYSSPQVWIDKLFAELAAGRTKQAIVLVNNATETAWFQRLLSEAKLVCFPARRLAFWRHDHADVGARQGQALFYFGSRAEVFYGAFSATGAIMRRLK